jgi:hypothetical protein
MPTSRPVVPVFEAGPYAWLPAVLPLGKSVSQRAWLLALLAAVLGWLPLLLLSSVEGLALSANPRESFLLDLSSYARYVVALPVFVLAGSVYRPYLTTAVRQLVDAGIVGEADLPAYRRLVESTRTLLVSHWIEALLLVFAIAVSVEIVPIYPSDQSSWYSPLRNGESHRSLAGWWRTLVSQPLFLSLTLVWFWRALLWVRFVARVSGLDLRLVASHPDRLGGLRFMVLPLRGFAVLAFGIGAIVASDIAERVLFDGRSLVAYKYFIGAQVVGTVIFFGGPLLLLMRPLATLKARGTLDYGRLATDVGHEFERKWIARNGETSPQPLESPDFSATTDLFAIAANVRNINLFVLDIELTLLLVLASLLPYLPLIFAIMPVDDIIRLTLGAFV